MAMAGGIMKIVGGVIQAGGIIQQGREEANRQNYIEGVHRESAKAIRANAAEDAIRYRRDALRQRGASKAVIGSSGLQATGSSNDVLFEGFLEEELQVATIKYKGELAAIGEDAQAALASSLARSARHAANTKAAASLLNTASSAIGSFGGGGFGGSGGGSFGGGASSAGASIGGS